MSDIPPNQHQCWWTVCVCVCARTLFSVTHQSSPAVSYYKLQISLKLRKRTFRNISNDPNCDEVKTVRGTFELSWNKLNHTNKSCWDSSTISYMYSRPWIQPQWCSWMLTRVKVKPPVSTFKQMQNSCTTTLLCTFAESLVTRISLWFSKDE